MKKFFSRILVLAMILILMLVPTFEVEAAGKANRLNFTKKTITIGKSFNLKVKKRTKGAKVSYSTTKAGRKIVKINKKGKITAKKSGKAIITVKITKKGMKTVKRKCTVKVIRGAKTVKINQSSFSLHIGNKRKLNASMTKKGHGDKITWSSSNNKVASITKKGEVKGLSAGKTTITAKTISGKKSSIIVTVIAKQTSTPTPTPTKISLSASQNELVESSEQNLVYFYAEVTGYVDSVFLLDDSNNILSEMKDDGIYSDSGDDIENDGIFTCSMYVDTAVEKTYKYRAKLNVNKSSKISNEIFVEVIAELSDSEMETIENVSTSLNELLGSDKPIEEMKISVEQYLDQLRNDGVISDLIYDEGTSAFAFNYVDIGVIGGAFLKPLSTGNEANPIKSSDRTTRGNEVVNESGLIEASNFNILNASSDVSSLGNVMILNNFADETDNDVFNQPYKDIHSTFQNAGFKVTNIWDATANDYKSLQLYDFIAVNSHGTYFPTSSFLFWQWDDVPVIITEETVNKNSKSTYSADLKKKRLVIGSFTTGDAFCITPGFFDFYYNSNKLNHSIFWGGFCRGYDDDQLVASINNAGASAVLAYENSVLARYDGGMLVKVVDDLLEGKTIGSAVSSAKALYGNNDGQAELPAVLKLRGDTKATLVNTDIRNGSFEMASIPTYWRTVGDIRVISKLGEFKPRHGDRMAMLSTGIGSALGSAQDFHDGTQGSYKQQVIRVSGNANKLSFDFNFISEEPSFLDEYANYVGSRYNDAFMVEVIEANGNRTRIVEESVNSSKWIKTPLTGFRLTQGNTNDGRPPYHIGWKLVQFDLSPYRGQTINLRFVAFDRGDNAFDSVGLVDNVRIS